MKVLNIAISELQGMPYQPEVRTIEKHISGLKKSVEEMGLLVPILVDKDNNIIDGHRRVAVFKALNLASIPAIQYNGEMKGLRSIDAYASINTTQRKMNALEQLDVYLRGGKALGGVKKAIEWTEEHLGRGYLEQLLKNCFSPYYVVRLKNIAHRCGYKNPTELRKFYNWAMRHGQFAQLMTIEKVNADVRCVRSAVASNRPLKKRVSFN
jgi:ParB/RepB/Spo0J family partition protein